MPLGNPITIENESRIISVTTTSTNDTFTVEGGYKINHINVYRNGVRLVSGNDFLANDATTVQLINSPNIGDVIEFHLFGEFLVNDAIVGAATSQTIYGDLTINGNLYYNNSLVIGNATYADVAGIATVAEGLTGSPDISVGQVTTSGVINAGGNINGNVTGNLTGNVNGDLTGTASLATNAQGLTGTPDIDVRNITGVAATFTGTISYEDVTNVDAIGVITARSGIRVVGGGVTVTGAGAMVVSQSTVGQPATLFLGKGGPSKVFSVDESGNTKIGSNIDNAGTTGINLNVGGSANFSDDVTVDGDVLPGADGTRDLGSTTLRWANLYTSDLDLSNETKGGNEVDGTWGAYTIQEGEDDLFLINRRTGKKYKFMLQEVS